MTAAERLPRLLALLPWLRRHPGVRVADAAAEFGISERQLRDDLQLLYWCGLPGLGATDLIDLEFEGDTVTVLDAQTLDRPLRLTGDEALALLVAVRALADVPGLDAGPDAPLARALAKLTDAVGGPESTVEVDLAAGGEDPQTVAVVRRAVDERRRLHLSYLVERRDEVTERDVDPATLHLRSGRLYLEAWDREREAPRLFRLDRVVAARLLDAPAEPPPGAVPLDLADGLFRPDPADTRVVLELGAAARWVADYHVCDEVTELPGGGLRVVLRTPDPAWVARLALRLGQGGRVVEPPELAERARVLARTALAAYSRSG